MPKWDTDILTAALCYARMGLCVLPVSREKRPLIPKWPETASKDPEVIRRWWKRWPGANVAIACGQRSHGLVVLDIDIHPERNIRGDIAIEQWQKEHGRFPASVVACTGSGGRHYYFFDPASSNAFHNAVSLLNGVDLRTDGGCIIAPPSIHANGKRYEWLDGKSPILEGIARVNASVYELLQLSASAGQKDSEKKGEPAPLDFSEAIKQGTRNETVFRYARDQAGKGVPQDITEEAALQLNARFSPPLDAEEVRKTVRSAYTRTKKHGEAIFRSNKERTAEYFVKHYKRIGKTH